MPEKSLKTILITGGAGFIGGNFLKYFIAAHPQYRIVNLDKLTYAADLNFIADLKAYPSYHFIQGDIADAGQVMQVFQDYDVQGIIHFAAESHVDNSIKGPRSFVETNVMGTFNLLDAARQHWMDKPHAYKPAYVGCRFHHISTDEVFGTLGEEGFFTEQTPYAPNSPYSATKAGSDMLVRAYYHTFGLNVTTSNCSNNYGPGQHDEKLIPTVIRACLQGRPIPIYGTGKNVRDWLYVEDHCHAIDLIYHQGKAGEIYNVGGKAERTNLQIVQAICAYLNEKKPRTQGPYQDLITFTEDRPGHDQRYAIDFSKIHQELNWTPKQSLDTGLAQTIDFYIRKYA